MRVDDSRLQGIPRYKTNNCKSLSLARCEFKRLAEDPLGQADMLVARISVARVRPRTSKGITDLLLPQTSSGLKHIAVPLRSLHPAQGRAILFSRLGSRSLTELTRQITPDEFKSLRRQTMWLFTFHWSLLPYINNFFGKQLLTQRLFLWCSRHKGAQHCWNAESNQANT